MFMLGPIGFAAPWLLLALAALPVLWILLRAVPPAPVRRAFAGVALLLGLSDDESQTARTPWWLLLLRLLAVAAVIVGFAGPVLNPATPDAAAGRTGPLLVLVDGGWADARDWPMRVERIERALSDAGRSGRPVALVMLADPPAPGDLPFMAADAWAARLPGLAPQPWAPDADAVAAWAAGLAGDFDTLWLSSGLAADWRAPVLASLEARGRVQVFEGTQMLLGLRLAGSDGDTVSVAALRAHGGPAQDVSVLAFGPDPAGQERVLARATARFDAAAPEAIAALSLPAEIRNRVTRFAIEGQRSAGAVALVDDGLRRREVALIAGSDDREGLELLSQLHYLRSALEPASDLIEGVLGDVLPANPDVIVLADMADVPDGQAGPLAEWVDAGGLLLRFAGPRLAASDISRDAEDPLMPVRLRSGGRSVGGAMSWGTPRALAPFAEDTPFYGLRLPDDVHVSAQVMAQPGPELGARVIAALEDGTPLVTRKRLGDGQVVLFHVTANAEWSTLPLSGLFVQMLERLAISAQPAIAAQAELAGRVFTPDVVLDGFGALHDAGSLAGVPGEDLAPPAGPRAGLAPGLYAGDDRRVALNVIGPDTVLAAASWPAHIMVEGLERPTETALKPALLLAALALLAADMIASLALGGRLRRAPGAAALLGALLVLSPQPGLAQSDDAFAIAATRGVVLAHVKTGDPALDDIARAGLAGLSRTLFERTSIEPDAPVAVDLETDELAFFPVLYWPISPDQPRPSSEAYVKLNRYLHGGGMIIFDTRDGDVAQFGSSSPAGRRLQELAAELDIPPLEPIPSDHVLTRTFYLLQDFPGRHTARDIWVEAAPADAEQIEGMPFRNLNDNVTPVVIGGNDWAGAWAVDTRGAPLLPVGRGYTGERQRELALRFGVNLVMHVLTGNYKSDQVHVPALLDRLGQ